MWNKGERVKFGIRVIRRAISDLNQQSLLQTAAGLTFGSLVALVPLFAVFFSIIQVLVPEEAISLKLQGWLLDTFMADNVKELSQYFEQFLTQSTQGALGLVGLGVLLPTIFSLLLSVEKSVNHLWRAKKTRNLVRRLMAFYAVLSLTPASVVVAMLVGQRMNLNASERVMGVGMDGVLSFSLIVLGLFLMYKLLPHRQVKTRPALISSVTVAVLFLVLRFGFGLYVSFFASTSMVGKIYGTLAILPVLCLWVYLIWILVLAGVAGCVYLQYPRLLDDRHSDETQLHQTFTLNPSARWTIIVLSYVAHHFRENGGPMLVESIADQLQLTVFDIEEVVGPSIRVGWLVYVPMSEGEGVLPAQPLEGLSFADLYALKHNLSLSLSTSNAPRKLLKLWHQLEQVDRRGAAELAKISIGEFTHLQADTQDQLMTVSTRQ